MLAWTYTIPLCFVYIKLGDRNKRWGDCIGESSLRNLQKRHLLVISLALLGCNINSMVVHSAIENAPYYLCLAELRKLWNSRSVISLFNESYPMAEVCQSAFGNCCDDAFGIVLSPNGNVESILQK